MSNLQKTSIISGIIFTIVVLAMVWGCGSSSGGGGSSAVIETPTFEASAITTEEASIGGTTVTREVVSNKVLVTLSSGKSESDLQSSLPAGYSIVGKNSVTGNYEIGVPSGTSITDAITQISSLSAVNETGHDIALSTYFWPNDDTFSLSNPESYRWPYISAEATWAWDLCTGEARVLIAVIDSGLDLDHDEFTSRVISGPDYYDGNTPEDIDGHGTKVTGMAAAMGNNNFKMAGMDWHTKILVIRVCSDGKGSTSALANAVTYVCENYASAYDAIIINTSSGVELDENISADRALINKLKSAAATCASKGNVLWVAAAGNNNKDAAYTYPAALSQNSSYRVISIGGHNQSGGRWSGTYDDTFWASNYGSSVDLCAAANNIYTTSLMDGAATDQWGTSLATPLIAGAAALLKSFFSSQSISLPPATIKEILISGGDTLSTDQSIGKKLNLKGAILAGLELHNKTVLSISCNVGGASIAVDGTSTGKLTSAEGYTRVVATAGSRTITITKTGYDTYQTTTTCSAGVESELAAVLTPSSPTTTYYTYGPYPCTSTPTIESLSIPDDATIYLGNASSEAGEKPGFFDCGYAGYLKINGSYAAYNMYHSGPSGSDWTTFYCYSSGGYNYGTTETKSAYAKYRSNTFLADSGRWVNITNLVTIGATNTFTFDHATASSKGFIIRIDQ